MLSGAFSARAAIFREFHFKNGYPQALDCSKHDININLCWYRAADWYVYAGKHSKSQHSIFNQMWKTDSSEHKNASVFYDGAAKGKFCAKVSKLPLCFFFSDKPAARTKSEVRSTDCRPGTSRKESTVDRVIERNAEKLQPGTSQYWKRVENLARRQRHVSRSITRQSRKCFETNTQEEENSMSTNVNRMMHLLTHENLRALQLGNVLKIQIKSGWW